VSEARHLRRIGEPRPATVQAGLDGIPAVLGSSVVDVVAEDWVVEDRWWTGRPLRRRYFELVLESGANTVVFRDLLTGAWYVQRA
jgi:hypothetical protein